MTDIDTSYGSFGGRKHDDPNTQRREGFNSNSGGSSGTTDSYGAGAGSDAVDLANTGLGGYGQSTKMGGAFGGNDGFSVGNNDPDISGGHKGNDHTQRREGFKDTSGASGGSYGEGPGSDATDPANTGLGGYGTSKRDEGDNVDRDSNTNTDQFASGTVEGSSFISSNVDSGFNSTREDAHGGQSEGGQPGYVEKIRGAAEQLAGTMTGDPNLKARGQERQSGESTNY